MNGASADEVQALHANHKATSALQGGVGVVDALAAQHGVSVAAARAIFEAGEASGDTKGRCSQSGAGRGGAEVRSSNSSPEEPQEDDALSVGFSFAEGREVTLEQLRREQARFAREREWDQFHTPRNLALALVGEVGELCEIFQWKGEVTEGLPELSAKEVAHVGQELSDVLLYLLRLADKCHVDLPKVAQEKMALNRLKYPAEKVKGSSKKYSEY